MKKITFILEVKDKPLLEEFFKSGKIKLEGTDSNILFVDTLEERNRKRSIHKALLSINEKQPIGVFILGKSLSEILINGNRKNSFNFRKAFNKVMLNTIGGHFFAGIPSYGLEYYEKKRLEDIFFYNINAVIKNLGEVNQDGELTGFELEI